jgi:hypothetical protein
MVGWILFALLVLLLLWIIYIYNSLVALTNDVKNAFTQIDVQLKRRHDLIPNLVSVVKGYMEYERDVLERLTTARMKALSAAATAASPGSMPMNSKCSSALSKTGSWQRWMLLNPSGKYFNTSLAQLSQVERGNISEGDDIQGQSSARSLCCLYYFFFDALSK